MRNCRIAAIPGDGIGQEVIGAGVSVLEHLSRIDDSFSLRFDHFPWSSAYCLQHGRYIPEGGLDFLKTYDAIFFGAVGSVDVPDHVSLRGLRLPIAQEFDQYANVRPARALSGVTSLLGKSAAIDWVIVRENSEGEYAGHGGRAHRGLPIEVGTETAVFARVGVERIDRFAFELAAKRSRKQLTLVTKSSAQRFGMVMWDEIVYEVAKAYPDVRTDRELVDAVTIRMVQKPHTLAVILATNLHADILSDLAVALSGSLGIGPTANLNPERAFPSMFEQIHGFAFDIAGKGVANPVATFWTASMMLEQFGEAAAARRLRQPSRPLRRRDAPHLTSAATPPPRKLRPMYALHCGSRTKQNTAVITRVSVRASDGAAQRQICVDIV